MSVLIPCKRCGRMTSWTYRLITDVAEDGIAQVTVTPVNEPPHYCPRPKSAPPGDMRAAA